MGKFCINQRGPAVTFIVGLAGSGKTRLLKNLVYDAVMDDDFWFSDEAKSENHAALLALLKDGKHCVIAERQFMFASRRDEYEKQLKADFPDVQVNWLFFENDLESANHNCESRSPKRGDIGGTSHIDQNKNDSPCYNIPEHAPRLKIHPWPGMTANEAGDCVQSIGG